MQLIARSFVLIVLITFTFSLLSHAAKFQVSLKVITPISISNTTPLHLSRILAENNSASCTLSAGGVRSGSACLGGETGAVGVFSVAGSAGEVIDIVLAGSTANGMTFVPTLLNNGQGGLEGSGITLKEDHQLLIGGTITIDDVDTVIAVTDPQPEYSVNVTYQ